MAKFKLLVGQHIQSDPDSPVLTAEQVKAGARRPSRTYTAGQTVVSDDDLVARHGAERFTLLSGTPKKSKTPVGMAVAPGGQVSTGLQSASGTPGGTVSGLVTDPPDEDDEDGGGGDDGVDLNRMTVQELKEYAEEKEIDLGYSTRKEDIVRVIRSAQG